MRDFELGDKVKIMLHGKIIDVAIVYRTTDNEFIARNIKFDNDGNPIVKLFKDFYLEKTSENEYFDILKAKELNEIIERLYQYVYNEINLNILKFETPLKRIEWLLNIEEINQTNNKKRNEYENN